MNKAILDRLINGPDGIYGYDFDASAQADEIAMRSIVADAEPGNDLDIISRHHSIPVMDREVRRFLRHIPKNGVIIDVGGCWGWHWRNIAKTRPDVSILIVDIVRANLSRAKLLLGGDVGKNVFLVHGDACQLKFPDNSFDGYWSSQTLQHIPDLRKALLEARRVLKPGGIFSSYMINDAAMVRSIFTAIGRPYHLKGNVPGSFYLSRATDEHTAMIEGVFSNKVRVRYSEVLFQPELKFAFSGRTGSLLGRLDSLISGRWALPFIARQRSFHTAKT